jgi:hypothetical protein
MHIGVVKDGCIVRLACLRFPPRTHRTWRPLRNKTISVFHRLTHVRRVNQKAKYRDGSQDFRSSSLSLSTCLSLLGRTTGRLLRTVAPSLMKYRFLKSDSAHAVPLSYPFLKRLSSLLYAILKDRGIIHGVSKRTLQ